MTRSRQPLPTPPCPGSRWMQAALMPWTGDILGCLAENYAGGPVGVETLAAVLAEQRDMLEEVIEPYLLQTGLIMRTPRGRCLSTAGWAYLGMTPPESATRQLDMLSDLGSDHDG